MKRPKRPIAVAFGHCPRKFRLRAGLSQIQLGLLANYDRHYIGVLERGLRIPFWAHPSNAEGYPGDGSRYLRSCVVAGENRDVGRWGAGIATLTGSGNGFVDHRMERFSPIRASTSCVIRN
jgi:hypothetical protein